MTVLISLSVYHTTYCTPILWLYSFLCLSITLHTVFSYVSVVAKFCFICLLWLLAWATPIPLSTDSFYSTLPLSFSLVSFHSLISSTSPHVRILVPLPTRSSHTTICFLQANGQTLGSTITDTQHSSDVYHFTHRRVPFAPYCRNAVHTLKGCSSFYVHHACGVIISVCLV